MVGMRVSQQPAIALLHVFGDVVVVIKLENTHRPDKRIGGRGIGTRPESHGNLAANEMIDEAGPDRANPFEAASQHVHHRRAMLERNIATRIHGRERRLGGKALRGLELEPESFFADDQAVTASTEPDPIGLQPVSKSWLTYSFASLDLVH